MESEDTYPNPITASFRVLENYRRLLPEALRQQGSVFDEETRRGVMDQMDVDRGIMFSLNTSPPKGESACEDFLREKGLNEQLEEILYEQFGEGGTSTDEVRLYAHQEEAISNIVEGGPHGERHTVIATGTGSGKTEAFLIPALDCCLSHPGETGIKALLVYPMNALANDQLGRIAKWTRDTPVSFGAYVGSTPDSLSTSQVDERRKHGGHLVTRKQMRDEPPDILLTNYVMLDYMLTRGKEAEMFKKSAETLQYLVLDEVHTYRGTKATHLMHLLRRLQHRLATEPTKIATSATLISGSDDRQQAYMRGDEEALDQFIKPLLDVSDFNYISLGDQEEDEQEIPSGESGKSFTDTENAGWFFGRDSDRQKELLEGLTGMEMRSSIIYHVIDRAYDDLRDDAFVRRIRREMKQRACSFQDLVGFLRETHSLHPSHDEEAIAKTYLSAISLVNWLAPHREQLLDFRMHLFLRDIGGHLKKCLHCDHSDRPHYHSGGQDICPNCGNPLFTVYRENIDKCVARITGRHLSYDLRPTSDETEKPVYVLLSRREEESDEEVSFGIEDLSFSRDRTSISYAEEGAYQIELLEQVANFDKVSEHLIRLRDPHRDYDYLSKLAQSLLDYDPSDSGKLLGFVDSRERVSRYGSALRDDFASWYLRAWLRKQLQLSRPLPKVAEHLHSRRPKEPDSEVESGIFAEMNLWFARLTGQSVQGEDHLALDVKQELNDLEQAVLDEVFLPERAIDREGDEGEKDAPYYAFYQRHSESPPEESEYIRMHKYLAVRRNGVYIEEGAGGEKPNEAGIALTPQAQTFASFLERHGVEQVQEAVRSLRKKGVLCERRVSGDHTHYYLRPCYVVLKPERLSVPGYGEELEDEKWSQIRHRLLRSADSHSSEREAKTREDIEEAFDDGDLNVLMATPTLEMGVDIGKLRTVLMAGVPPMPSNYAQRAGRAGRNRDDGQALIVTFCFDKRSHDAYYFGYPTRMVDGYVTPPVFNEEAAQVAQKHLNAWMVEGYAGSKNTLDNYAAKIEEKVSERIRDAEMLFGNVAGLNVRAYLRERFQEELYRQVSGFSKSSIPQRLLYQSGFFPDYSFRKDQIPLVKAEHIEEEAADETITLQDRALSERAPELAYYKFSPGTDVYVGGRMLRIAHDAPHELEEIDGQPARSYRCFAAHSQEQFASPYAARTVFDRSELFSADFDAARSYEKKPLTIRHLSSCELGFRNDGTLKQGESEAFSDDEGNIFSVGYRFDREALLLSLDKSIWQNESLIVSLAFAIDRAIKDHFGLDEGEVRMLVEPERIRDEEDGEADDVEGNDPGEQHHVLFYDYDGNANVPFEGIFDALEDESLFHEIHERLTSCDCDAGCYLCMRSYSTQFHADAIDKEGAVMFADYLRGEGPFRARPEEYSATGGRADVELIVSVKGERFEVEGDQDNYDDMRGPDDDHNTVLFSLLAKAVREEWGPGKHTISIVSADPFVVKAINDHEVKKGREAFARLLFQLLRFRHSSARSQ